MCAAIRGNGTPDTPDTVPKKNQKQAKRRPSVNKATLVLRVRQKRQVRACRRETMAFEDALTLGQGSERVGVARVVQWRHGSGERGVRLQRGGIGRAGTKQSREAFGKGRGKGRPELHGSAVGQRHARAATLGCFLSHGVASAFATAAVAGVATWSREAVLQPPRHGQPQPRQQGAARNVLPTAQQRPKRVLGARR
jgi:hypothetical protein